MIIRPEAVALSPVAVVTVTEYGYIPLPALFPLSSFPSQVKGGKVNPVDGTVVFMVFIIIPFRL